MINKSILYSKGGRKKNIVINEGTRENKVYEVGVLLSCCPFVLLTLTKISQKPVGPREQPPFFVSMPWHIKRERERAIG